MNVCAALTWSGRCGSGQAWANGRNAFNWRVIWHAGPEAVRMVGVEMAESVPGPRRRWRW